MMQQKNYVRDKQGESKQKFQTKFEKELNVSQNMKMVYMYIINFHKEMNFGKIIKQMENLALKHKAINEKYSSSKNKYVYNDCMIQDEASDLKIYGHTHSDTLQKFNRRFNSAKQQRKSLELPLESHVKQNFSQSQFKRHHIRSQTAHRPTHRKTNPVLQIYDKQEQAKVHKGLFQQIDNQLHNQINLSNHKEHVVSCKNQIRKKSIVKFRKQFNSNFEDDLRNAKVVQKQITKNTKMKQICFEPGNVQQLQTEQKQQFALGQLVFFELTQNKENYRGGTIKSCTVSKTRQMLQKLNGFIFDVFDKSLLSHQKVYKSKEWVGYVDRILSLQNVKSLTFIIVSTNDLSVYEVLHEDMSQLGNWLKSIFRSQKIMHLHIFKGEPENAELVYEQFLVAPSLLIQYLEWNRIIFRYYLRRFLLLGDQKMKIFAAIQQQTIFFESFHQVPKKFYRFIHELNQKPFSIITHRLNRSQGFLGQLLQEGFNQIQMRRFHCRSSHTFIYGEKTSQHTKDSQQIYFCICFLLSNYTKAINRPKNQ